MLMKVLLIVAVVAVGHIEAARLGVSGSTLVYDGQTVYLSGANAAWNSYGYDFGNGNYDGSLETWMADIGSAGGNSFRVWVHVEGYSTPVYSSSGFVTACDNTGDFINDVTNLLNAAQQSNVLVTLALFNAAVMSNQVLIDMILDDAKLQSYLHNCLTPLVQGVAGHPALGAWEAINEPEGSVAVVTDPNPCYDHSGGAGWTGVNIPMERMMHFVGKINQVVHSNDPTGLTTLGSGPMEMTDAFSDTFNYYSDSCLNGAAGGSGGAHIDFYQMHSYEWQGAWLPHAPFTLVASDYQLTKPIVIGEFSSSCAVGSSLEYLHEYAYDNGYSGTWTWHWTATGDCSDTQDVQRQGLSVLADRTDHGLVNIEVN